MSLPACTASFTLGKQAITPSGVHAAFSILHLANTRSTIFRYSMKSCWIAAGSSFCFICVEPTISTERKARSRPSASSLRLVSAKMRSSSW